MSRPLPRITASLLVIIVVALSVVLISGDNANTAWADMVETILNAKSAKFKMTVTIEGQPPQTVVAMALEPNRFRQEGPGDMVNIADWNVGKMVGLNPKEKKATVITMSDLPEEARSQSILQQVREHLLEEKTNPEVKREALGEKKIDGRSAVGFRITSPGQTMTIWGDPESGLPYRIESSMKMMPNAKVIMTDFEFNVDLDESLFSVEPPADYTVVAMDVPASKATEKDLLTSLRTYSDRVDGNFPDSLDMKSMSPAFKKEGFDKDHQPNDEETKELMELSFKLVRGFNFAMMLPEQAEATYAGKGIQRDIIDRPIFWYKPKGADKYRVIYADLTVKELDTAPEVEGSQPLSGAATDGS